MTSARLNPLQLLGAAASRRSARATCCASRPTTSTRACAASGRASGSRSTTSASASRRSTPTSCSCRRCGSSTGATRASSPTPGSAGPSRAQADYLAPEGYDVAYRTNAVTRDGEHGNALLSRWPIGDIGHHDVSDHRFEQRGLLHVPVHWNGSVVHAIVAHFGLIHSSRVRQVQRLGRVHRGATCRATSALVVAGDFNDWGEKLDAPMRALRPGARVVPGDPPRAAPPSRRACRCSRSTASTPAACAAVSTFVPRGTAWARMSDHLPLVAELTPA